MLSFKVHDHTHGAVRCSAADDKKCSSRFYSITAEDELFSDLRIKTRSSMCLCERHWRMLMSMKDEEVSQKDS